MRQAVEIKLKILPDAPGVYIMKDSRHEVLYVGKAKNLKKRVRNYFAPNRDSRNSVLLFVPQIHDLDYIVTDNEKEAFLLENNLIKKLKPKYNINLRDDQDFLCIRMNPKDEFPRLLFVRRPKNDGAMYFGPYPSGYSIKQLMRSLGKIFPLRRCSDHVFKNRSRPCILYQIKLCAAPCVGYISKSDYDDIVGAAVSFLKGNTRDIARDLQKKMGEASSEMRYEDAAQYRDKLAAISEAMSDQKIVAKDFKDKDVFGFARENENIAVSLLTVREGRLSGGKNFKLKSRYLTDDDVLSSFLGQYYLQKATFMPQQIVVPLMLEQRRLIEESFKKDDGVRPKVLIPRRGNLKKLVDLANKNACETISLINSESARIKELLQEAKLKLKLGKLPERIEGYDISNIQARHAVGSMVVFTGGVRDSDSYRKFKVRLLSGPDDYSMMNEVLSRRLSNESLGPLPDLIVIDGGKGQLAVASAILDEKSYEQIDVISIAKSRRLKDGKVFDRIFVRGRKNPLSLARDNRVLGLIAAVRDEAHRFAISYHRKLRSGIKQKRR